GNLDNNGAGAAWIFTRSNGVWSQAAKLFGIDATGNAQQGYSVALSADGNTAIVGGPADSSSVGAVWIFIRNGATWSQQGFKLVANLRATADFQGGAVALSADGNTAIVGGYLFAFTDGAVWVFTRASDGVWTQQARLLASAEEGARLGSAVAVS